MTYLTCKASLTHWNNQRVSTETPLPYGYCGGGCRWCSWGAVEVSGRCQEGVRKVSRSLSQFVTQLFHSKRKQKNMENQRQKRKHQGLLAGRRSMATCGDLSNSIREKNETGTDRNRPERDKKQDPTCKGKFLCADSLSTTVKSVTTCYNTNGQTKNTHLKELIRERHVLFKFLNRPFTQMVSFRLLGKMEVLATFLRTTWERCPRIVRCGRCENVQKNTKVSWTSLECSCNLYLLYSGISGSPRKCQEVEPPETPVKAGADDMDALLAAAEAAGATAMAEENWKSSFEHVRTERI